MACSSFRLFVEQEMGTFPHFVLYAVLEWILIALLFVDGIVAFVANEFAKVFELKAPCLFCSRIDHLLTHRDPDDCYNECMCEGHKKDVSSLAYCHVHRKLSDIRSMCEGCLLSFSPESKLDNAVGGTCKNHHHQQSLFDDELRARLKVPYWVKDEGMQGDKEDSANLCSCCRAPMKVKSSFQKVPPSHMFSSSASRVSQAPTPSPRATFHPVKNEVESRNLELPPIRYPVLKLSNNTPPEDEEGENVPITADAKAAAVPLLENDDLNLIDDATRTPSFVRGNRFFGNSLTDSPTASPRWAHRVPRKSLLDRVELASDPVDMGGPNEPDDSILNRLKRQVRLDRKSLIALYMELDEERSASAIAANNAMAMITRLQAEKAAVQMEALQYQRMMDEQAEYDQEALQILRDMVTKREEEIRELEDELDLYREKYGLIREVIKQDPLDVRCESFSSFTERSDQGSPHQSMSGTETEIELDHENASSDEDKDGGPFTEENGIGGDIVDRSSIDIIEHERSYLLSQLRILESKLVDKEDKPEEDRAVESDASVAEEVSRIGEKLKALEADSRFLQHSFLMLQKGGREGSELLVEIARHLQKLRNIQIIQSSEPAAASSRTSFRKSI
ncbi:hypothetical protein Dimus_023873 [Dionaea muscipula]